ncbi:hypothetical protein KEM55_007567, partial [Ascosphaera atra]
ALGLKPPRPRGAPPKPPRGAKSPGGLNGVSRVQKLIAGERIRTVPRSYLDQQKERERGEQSSCDEDEEECKQRAGEGPWEQEQEQQQGRQQVEWGLAAELGH